MQVTFWILIITYALWNCSAAFGGEVWNNISVGKFYKFSTPPTALYPDRWPVTVLAGGTNRELSHGAKLTDGEFDTTSSPWPLEKWVAWHDTSFEVIIDLGKAHPVSHIHARAASRTEWAIAYPAKLTISVSSDGTVWRPYGGSVTFRAASGAGWEVNEVQGTGGWTYDTRFVRYAFEPVAGQHIFLDELWVEGSISHTTKEASHDGAYHGAFPATEQGYLRLNEFENETGRRATMVLWYAGWDAPFTTTVGQLIDNPTSPSWIGDRKLEIGFLPTSPNSPGGISCTETSSCITSARIAAGSHDQFLFDWFVEAATRNRPFWIRPMNEMNGSWTWSQNNPPNNIHDLRSLRYGGDPSTYRWAWRRMYNIAEQAGATGERQIFVWAPDVHNDPDNGGGPTDLRVYYPGPQYVDWIGFSLYKGDPGESYEGLLKSAYNRDYTDDPLWRHSVSAKPFMIVEGGAVEFKVEVNPPGDVAQFQQLVGCWIPAGEYTSSGSKYTATSSGPKYTVTLLNKPQFIRGWFYRLPLLEIPVKAAVWFDRLSQCEHISTSEESLRAYRPYFFDR